MERVAIAGVGTQPEHWQSCSYDEGGALVSPEPLDTSVPDVTYKGLIRATPGEPNSQ
jgi:hypothetical protein